LMVLKADERSNRAVVSRDDLCWHYQQDNCGFCPVVLRMCWLDRRKQIMQGTWLPQTTDRNWYIACQIVWWPGDFQSNFSYLFRNKKLIFLPIIFPKTVDLGSFYAFSSRHQSWCQSSMTILGCWLQKLDLVYCAWLLLSEMGRGMSQIVIVSRYMTLKLSKILKWYRMPSWAFLYFKKFIVKYWLFDIVDLIKLVSNVCPCVRLYVRLSTKSFFDFNEIWHVGRGQWVMHGSIQYDLIQGED